jgi:hypothetical protein
MSDQVYASGVNSVSFIRIHLVDVDNWIKKHEQILANIKKLISKDL